jgi:hypothetical protein
MHARMLSAMDDAAAQLAALGKRRIKLLAQLAELEEQIRPLIGPVNDDGMSYDDIGTMIGLRRLAVANWRKQAGN